MGILPIDRKVLIALIKDVIEKDPSILQEVVTQIKEEPQDERRAYILAQLEADFERFDDVFKALA